MILLYAIEALVVAAGFAGMLRLRVAADEAWRRHRMLTAAAPIARAFAEFRDQIATQLSPVLAKFSRAMADIAGDYQWRTAVSSELVRLTLGGKPDRPELHTTAPGEGAS